MLEIKCGDPSKEPASSTRFVLPFAYHLEQLLTTEKQNQYYVAEDDPDKIWRERYLTEETADVLFRRTKWFVLKDDNRKIEFEIPKASGTGSLTVCIKPPRLVLFEWPKNIENIKKEEKENADLLHTGFLIVELYFEKIDGNCPTLDDMLKLNELFKYWQQPYSGHQDQKDGYKAFLADYPYEFGSSGKLGDKYGPAELYFDRWASLFEMPVQDVDTKIYYKLFPSDWNLNARDKVINGKKNKDPQVKDWLVYSDNRTFVWTCAIIDNGGDELRRSLQFQGKGLDKGKPWEFGHWIKLLNVDLPGSNCINTHVSTEFEREWAEERTYKRWEEWGAFYGFSYHSGAMIGPPKNDTEETPKKDRGTPIWKHFGQMYFDQALLLLYLRVTLFRFSVELNKISGEARDTEKGEEKWEEDFNKLRWEFTLFTNLYQFPLLSNQQQAVEMYTLARKCLDVDELFDEIEKEIHSSHDYLAVRQEQTQSESTTRLTVVATVGLVVVLVISFMGMSIFNESNSSTLQVITEIITTRWVLFSVLFVVFTLFLAATVFFSDWLAKFIDWWAGILPRVKNKLCKGKEES